MRNTTPHTATSRLASALLLAIGCIIAASPTMAQTTPPLAPSTGAGTGGVPAVGDLCYSRMRLQSGVFILDACGRLYCRPKADRDIIEVAPDFARRAACTWTVVNRLCKCLRNTPLDRPNGKKG